jgi:nucleotide-binding universal stress UspA family protein
MMRGTAKDGTTRRIVVGIDSSIGALLALDWAVREAQARECVLEVVHVWDNVPLPGNMFSSASEMRTASECFVANECAAVERTSESAPVLVPMSVQGAAGKVLVEQSAGAEMLVVGRGRHAAVKDLLPRSISATVVRGATCPVVVVPVPDVDAPQRATAARRSAPAS